MVSSLLAQRLRRWANSEHIQHTLKCQLDIGQHAPMS